MSTTSGGTGSGPRHETSILRRHDIAMAVNAFLATNTPERSGRESARLEQRQHVRRIQQRYWPILEEVLAGALKRRRGTLELTDEERLFTDLGLVDARMMDNPAEAKRTVRNLMAEIRAKGLSGCYYFSEWLAHRQQQSQLESELNWADQPQKNDYAGQLDEARRRVLSRLSPYLSGLPGVSMEVADMLRSGNLDKAVIASGITALRNPVRKNLLRRHRLWSLREQILSKARARAESQATLKLFEMLNEVYIREWRSSHDAFVTEDAYATSSFTRTNAGTRYLTPFDPETDAVMREVRRMRMRMRLLETVDGRDDSDIILHDDGPRLTRPGLAPIIQMAQTFDRGLAEQPSIVIVPGNGRGFFAWESGCLILALRPLVGADDSVATGLAWMRMLTDRLHNGGGLRNAYETAFPGASFPNDFPADYRSWMCRLTKGDASALSAERRSFFRDCIGPELSGPLLPPNLRNLGPQTMTAICRRLEKQVAAGDADANLHRRLAAVYWQQGEMEAAGLQFNAAMQIAPEDGETLFTAGMFMRSRDDAEAANDCFRLGAEKAADNMWGVYCRDAADGLF